MSEIPKTQKDFDEQFNSLVASQESMEQEGSVGEQQETLPTREEQIEDLLRYFKSGEAPHSLEELSNIAAGLSEEWQEQGFKAAATYLDTKGDLILVAPSKENHPDYPVQRPGEGPESTWRFLIDGQMIEITIPSEWSGGSMHFRGTGHFEGVYQLPNDGKDMELSDNMRRIVDKLGSSVTMSDSREGEGLGRRGTVGLNDVKGALSLRDKKQREADEEDAYTIEASGKKALASVKKGLFMSAEKYARLQDEAYRSGLKRGADLVELRKPISPIEEPDPDDWDHGPDFR